MQQRIRALDADHAYAGAEYKEIDTVLTSFFTCRTTPMPACVAKSIREMNTEIYVGMQGASEFTIGHRTLLADAGSTN